MRSEKKVVYVMLATPKVSNVEVKSNNTEPLGCRWQGIRKSAKRRSYQLCVHRLIAEGLPNAKADDRRDRDMQARPSWLKGKQRK